MTRRIVLNRIPDDLAASLAALQPPVLPIMVTPLELIHENNERILAPLGVGAYGYWCRWSPDLSALDRPIGSYNLEAYVSLLPALGRLAIRYGEASGPFLMAATIRRAQGAKP